MRSFARDANDSNNGSGTDNRQHVPEQLVAVSVIMLAIGSVLLGLHIYASSLRKTPRGWNDHLLPPSWLSLVGLVLINCLYFTSGGAWKTWDSSSDEEDRLRAKLIFALYCVYPISSTLPRASVLALYLRVFTDELSRIASWVVLAFIVANCISAVIVNTVQCVPLTVLWYPGVIDRPYKCIDVLLWWKVSNIPNIVADVAILFLPARTIWRLKTSTSRKVGLAMVFITGSVGLAASCVRTSQVFLKVIDSVDNEQATVNYYVLLLWATAECGLYFWAACLIGLRPVVTKFNQCVFRDRNLPQVASDEISANGRLTDNAVALSGLPRRSGSSSSTNNPATFSSNGNNTDLQGSHFYK